MLSEPIAVTLIVTDVLEATSFQQYRDLLVTYLRPLRRRVALLAVALFASIGLQLVNPQILRHYIDTARSGGSTDALAGAAMLFLLVVFVGQAVSALATYLSVDIGWAATNALRADLTLHCLRLDLSFHKERTSGELIERVDGDVTALSNFFSQFVIRILGNLLLLVGVLILVAREDWRMGLALTAYTVVVLAVLKRVQQIVVPHYRAVREAVAEQAGYWSERLSGTEDIVANGAAAWVLRGQYERQRATMRVLRKSDVMGRVPQSTLEISMAIGNGMVFALSAYLLDAGTMTIGSVYLIFYYAGLLSWNLWAVSEQVDDLLRATAGIQRINEIYHIRSRIQDGRGDPLPAGPLAVDFCDVSFGYVAGSPVLKGLSFQLAPGKVLGLLGRTGSGKTSLARLVDRFYDPDQGAVRLAGVDVRDARLDDLRQRIGMVTQDVQLFHATLRDNLTFFDRTIPDEQLLRAIHELGLGAWYASLPDGLDTLLAPGGGSGALSAGEAQLLAFTRVFLKNPGLVILDEASSRLDPATEYLVQKAVDRLLSGRTAIVIAHRLTTVERADEIMILEDGVVVEHGPRAHLAADPSSRFARLLRTGLDDLLA